MAEMFRACVLGKVAGYLQNDVITHVLTDTDLNTPKDVRDCIKSHWPHLKTPTTTFIRNCIDRLTRSGNMHSLPSPDGVLPLWATDTHYCKVSRHGRLIHLTLKLPGLGVITLQFKAPGSKRFEGKMCRPTLFCDRSKNSRVCFAFTVQSQAPQTYPKSSTYLGVDDGQVETCVGTLVNGREYSSPIKEGKAASRITSKIDRMWGDLKSVRAKRDKCLSRGHDAKAAVLDVEAKRLRSKISRLKAERSHRVASQLVDMASRHGAVLVIEDLSWAPSGSWDRSRRASDIEHTARRRGVPVRKVNPAYSSVECSWCKSKKTRFSGRRVVCLVADCGRVIDRDVAASRNLPRRLVKSLDYRLMIQSLAYTRVSEPVAPGNVSSVVAEPSGFAT